MNRLLVFTFIFFVSVYALNLNAQEISIFKSSNQNINIISDTLDILAGQEINLGMLIFEDNDTVFDSTGDSRLITLELNTPCKFLNSMLFETNNAGDIDQLNDPYTNTEQIVYKSVKVVTETNEDTIFVSNINVKIPTSISNESYFVLRLTQDLNGQETKTDTLLTFHYQKPLIEVLRTGTKACYNAEVACKVSVTEPVGLEYALFIGEEIQKNGDDTIYVSSSASADVLVRDVFFPHKA